MSTEAHVKRLCRGQCCTACFLRLVRPTTRQKCQFGAKVLACAVAAVVGLPAAHSELQI